MGSAIDVMKLRSSLELFLKIAAEADGSLRVQLTEILSALR
jgi:hypothetical protein